MKPEIEDKRLDRSAVGNGVDIGGPFGSGPGGGGGPGDGGGPGGGGGGPLLNNPIGGGGGGIAVPDKVSLFAGNVGVIELLEEIPIVAIN